ncbi:MAG TPA: MBL fold metallo-hydrolase [Clostridia bacterium]|nr:MBL fold metallo-hydrolase [Clostridia bacterium]
MKVTALIENKAGEGLFGEHGLAVHIEYNGKQYLLDTGASDQFIVNAGRLGINLAEVDTAFLSHSHYDHSSGFGGFFGQNDKARVYLQNTAKEACYIKIGPFRHYVGIPKGLLEKYSERFVFLDGDHKVDEGVWLVSHKTEGLASIGKKARMYRKTKNGLTADDFGHEQSLVFEAGDGLVILNSCSHGGIDNIVEEVGKTFDGREVTAVFGGFHLMGFRGNDTISGKPEDIKGLGKRLKDLGVKNVYTGHCTGNTAFNILKEELGERLHYFHTGASIEL